MTNEEKEEYQEYKDLINEHGFHYAWAYIQESKIENVTFQRLRAAYSKAQDRLEKYIQKHAKD